jgi:hypothetical protein
MLLVKQINKEVLQMEKFREFRSKDWKRYPGALVFKDDTDPMIFEEDDIIVVVMECGIYFDLSVETEDHDTYGLLMVDDIKWNILKKAQGILEIIKPMTRKEAIEYLNDTYHLHMLHY